MGKVGTSCPSKRAQDNLSQAGLISSVSPMEAFLGNFTRSRRSGLDKDVPQSNCVTVNSLVIPNGPSPEESALPHSDCHPEAVETFAKRRFPKRRTCALPFLETPWAPRSAQR